MSPPGLCLCIPGEQWDAAAGSGGTRAGTAPGSGMGLGPPSHCAYGSPHGVFSPPLGGSNGTLVPCPAWGAMEGRSSKCNRDTFSTRISPHAKGYHIVSLMTCQQNVRNHWQQRTTGPAGDETQIPHITNTSDTEDAPTTLPRPHHSAHTNLLVPSPG